MISILLDIELYSMWIIIIIIIIIALFIIF
jgi:hypothetical protein